VNLKLSKEYGIKDETEPKVFDSKITGENKEDKRS